tara:strand:+ start:326 stop:1195 length:870 start_codon:yes stop_codon:yes gene_type:complete
MSLQIKLRGIYLKLYYYFRKKFLFKDGYGLKYFLYENARPNDSFNLGVRTDDTTVLYVIDKILSSSSLTNSKSINCLDVGGYIGIITLMMSKKLQHYKNEWKIHAFEPFEESFYRLKENIDLDPCKNNIVLNDLAVSDISGVSTLRTYQNSPGQNHLDIKNLDESLANDYKKNIKVITLEDYLDQNKIDHVNICKVDTEGADYFVIKGLNEYLEKKAVDYFIFEYQLITHEKIKNILSKIGYKLYYMVRNENLLIKSIRKYPKNCKSLLNIIAVSPNKDEEFIKKFNLG